MNKKLAAGLMVFVLSCSVAAGLQAAASKPIELAADTIDYDSVRGVIIAQGNVSMTQDNAVITGASAEYNSKTQEAYVKGSAKVVKDDATLTAAEVRSYNNTHMVAIGEPVLTKGENTLTGTQIDYYSDKQYAIVPENANLKMTDGTMTANKIESFFQENKIIANGNVHIASDVRKVDATSDQAVYYGDQNKQGKTVLTGNARAVQEGNTLTGNILTIYLDSKTMDAEGRSKLVIQPQS